MTTYKLIPVVSLLLILVTVIHRYMILWLGPSNTMFPISNSNFSKVEFDTFWSVSSSLDSEGVSLHGGIFAADSLGDLGHGLVVLEHLGGGGQRLYDDVY